MAMMSLLFVLQFIPLQDAQRESLPTLIEAKTYRYRGHSMADPAKYRTKEDLNEWKDRDPIKLTSEKLDSLNMKDVREKIDKKIEAEIADAVKFAEESEMPDPDTALDYVYIQSE